MFQQQWETNTLNKLLVFSLVIQLPSCVRLLATSCTAACQASLSLIISQSLPKLMSTESVMPSNHLILCLPLLLSSIFPSIRVFLAAAAGPGGRKRYIKRGAKGPGVSLSPVCWCAPSLSSLHVFGLACPHTSRMDFPAIF